ncbi:MAG: tRNA (adenosine(37)-N6)-threonylcarbamoyltransferase complex ATPase subunit type 1 TsaE [Rikenellaceae bacterium]
MKQIEIKSLSELESAARAIIEHLDGRNIVLLDGGMGAGKTTLTGALMRCLGSEDYVSSPTFAIVNEYDSPKMGTIYHFDMYRIESPREALDIGIEEYFDSGSLCLIEWAERIAELIPEDAMRVTIEATGQESRRVTIE